VTKSERFRQTGGAWRRSSGMVRRAPFALALLWPLTPLAGEALRAPIPIVEHDALSRPILMVVAGSSFVPAGTVDARQGGAARDAPT
jgi:hypothetical protein